MARIKRTWKENVKISLEFHLSRFSRIQSRTGLASLNFGKKGIFSSKVDESNGLTWIIRAQKVIQSSGNVL